VEKFGEKIHPKFKRVTVRNDGISIKVVSGTVINSVFIGKVSSIILIPGSNYSIILKHGSYYTVYTNLYKIFVSVGDVVKEGQDLGIIMSNNSKIKSVVFSFQIWHNKEKMDPNDWLINSFETQ